MAIKYFPDDYTGSYPKIRKQGGLVMAKSGRLELGCYKSIFNHCDTFGQQSNRHSVKTQKGLLAYYAVQGHSRS